MSKIDQTGSKAMSVFAKDVVDLYRSDGIIDEDERQQLLKKYTESFWTAWDNSGEVDTANEINAVVNDVNDDGIANGSGYADYVKELIGNKPIQSHQRITVFSSEEGRVKGLVKQTSTRTGHDQYIARADFKPTEDSQLPDPGVPLHVLPLGAVARHDYKTWPLLSSALSSSLAQVEGSTGVIEEAIGTIFYPHDRIRLPEGTTYQDSEIFETVYPYSSSGFRSGSPQETIELRASQHNFTAYWNMDDQNPMERGRILYVDSWPSENRIKSANSMWSTAYTQHTCINTAPTDTNVANLTETRLSTNDSSEPVEMFTFVTNAHKVCIDLPAATKQKQEIKIDTRVKPLNETTDSFSPASLVNYFDIGGEPKRDIPLIGIGRFLVEYEDTKDVYDPEFQRGALIKGNIKLDGSDSPILWADIKKQADPGLGIGFISISGHDGELSAWRQPGLDSPMHKVVQNNTVLLGMIEIKGTEYDGWYSGITEFPIQDADYSVEDPVSVSLTPWDPDTAYIRVLGLNDKPVLGSEISGYRAGDIVASWQGWSNNPAVSNDDTLLYQVKTDVPLKIQLQDGSTREFQIPKTNQPTVFSVRPDTIEGPKTITVDVFGLPFPLLYDSFAYEGEGRNGIYGWGALEKDMTIHDVKVPGGSAVEFDNNKVFVWPPEGQVFTRNGLTYSKFIFKTSSYSSHFDTNQNGGPLFAGGDIAEKFYLAGTEFPSQTHVYLNSIIYSGGIRGGQRFDSKEVFMYHISDRDGGTFRYNGIEYSRLSFSASAENPIERCLKKTKEGNSGQNDCESEFDNGVFSEPTTFRGNKFPEGTWHRVIDGVDHFMFPDDDENIYRSPHGNFTGGDYVTVGQDGYIKASNLGA